MEDYFGYDLFITMNITDIDDKIILRARRNYLFEEYKKSQPKITDSVKADLEASWKKAIAGLQKKIADLEKEIVEKQIDEKRLDNEVVAERNLQKEKLAKAEATWQTVQTASVGADAAEWLDMSKDPVAEYVDAQKGNSLDYELLRKLTQDHSFRFEKEFLEDLRVLGVRLPDVMTRVSEYVPEIIEMTQKIMSNGFAYETDGSVYFDVDSFDRSKDHFYAKLRPNAVGDAKLFAEGEGALSATGEKKSKNDFALWKKSKPGEPAWNSPWGLGRPGWHIECSAMAGKLLGNTLDIHAGGVDLKFPHHDNELAQSEAYFNNEQWVNYFLHSGHLHIDGLKMSKSLKNFISIKEALAVHRPRQLRMLFLLQAWDKPMNYQRKDTMADVESKEKAFSAFFLKVQALLQEQKSKIQTEAWNSKDMELHSKLQATQKEVHAALLDNFNTPSAMNSLVSIVNASNAYMSNNDERKPFLLRKVAVFVTRILRVFGLVDEPDRDFGWDSSAGSSSGKSHQDVAEPFVKALVQFRTQIRDAARSKSEHVSFLKLSDQLRDDVLPDLGVKLADDDPTFPYYFVDPAVLKREKEEKLKQENLKKRQKAERELTAKQNKLKEYKNGEVTPFDFIKQEYQITLNADGTIPASAIEAGLSKSKQKEIPKAFAKQQKAHDVFKAAVAANPSVVSDLEKEIQALEATVKSLE
eukprot:TRINITY_DN394_c0_g1_i1.p1 TRINITY_DN394_c0_g1~~TRINITY_DN394_c0_g1_i1.p1  ORF type:complete len:805 (-),score=211.69 TRINITY_DN394_c0_g1_i1:38-2125(-)